MVSVPVRAFAVAASIAADRFGENVADVFDVVPSRARMVAICALIELYPDASHVEIARCFGWQQSGNSLSAALTSARVSAWWRASDIEGVFTETRRALWNTPVQDLIGGKEPLQELSDPKATVYKRRKYTPSRIIQPQAPRGNVTAALLGDPPAGRREQLAAMRSQNYIAGNESGRFRYRGKRVLEAAE